MFLYFVIALLLFLIFLKSRKTQTEIIYIDSQLQNFLKYEIPEEDRVDLDYSDTHNVHNKTVRRSAENAIKKLQLSIDQNETRHDIRELFQYLEKYKNSRANRALHMILQINCYYKIGQICERDLIYLVWNRIHHPHNHGKIDLLKERLAQNLADCFKNDNDLHCCEGRVTRVLQSLQKADADDIVDLVPLWAIKEDIENHLIKYRQKLLEKAPVEYNESYNREELTVDDKNKLEIFNRCLISNLNRRFKKNYIETGLLTEPELDVIVKEYYDSLYEW